jgi:hypothetical protein
MPDNAGAGRAAAITWVVLVACCSGCMSTYEPVAAPGPSLVGSWKLNPTASDDPQKIIDHMRTEAAAKIARRMAQAQQAPPQQPQRPGGRPGAGSGSDVTTLADSYDPQPTHGPRPDPLHNSAMYHVLSNALARGDYLTVRETHGEVVLDYGTSVRSFTPGGHSVVSAEGGVGDQTTGWDKRDYVINVKAQLGPDVSERYALSGDGKHLIETLKIGPAELSQVTLTRVYDPTTEQAPRQLPTTD